MQAFRSRRLLRVKPLQTMKKKVKKQGKIKIKNLNTTSTFNPIKYHQVDDHQDENDEPPIVRIAENGYRLPDPLPHGTILTDSTKRQWQLGESIGCGGFGEIYCAFELPETDHHQDKVHETRKLENKKPVLNQANDRPKRSCTQVPGHQTSGHHQVAGHQVAGHKTSKGLLTDSNVYPFVVKVDHLNGPLYAEMHFYHRVAKPKEIDHWMLSKRLAFLGMPRYVASGIYTREIYNKRDKRIHHAKYRFLVLDRLGIDLAKILQKQDHKLDVKSAYTITMKVLDTLAYIHSFGYIHADIKADNLLLGRLEKDPPAREIYLIDYGLVERYMTRDGEHKEQQEDQRRANNGTIEFTSRDGHVGALSRRSDLETLAYNVISWLSGGRLPWMDIKDHEVVQKKKRFYMNHKNIDKLLIYAFGSKSQVPRGLEEFVKSISRLGFKEEPNYEQLKLVLTKAIVNSGYTNDGLIQWGKHTVNRKPNQKDGKAKKRPASHSPRQTKRRKTEPDIYEDDNYNDYQSPFEQFDHSEIPRKTNRQRQVRSAPATLSTERMSSSIRFHYSTPDLIEKLNPTPAMLDVIRMIEKKKLLANGHDEGHHHHGHGGGVNPKQLKTNLLATKRSRYPLRRA